MIGQVFFFFLFFLTFPVKKDFFSRTRARSRKTAPPGASSVQTGAEATGKDPAGSQDVVAVEKRRKERSRRVAA